MSATAQKRSVPPPVPPHRRSSTLLPPPNPLGRTDGRVPALSELLEQIVENSNAVEIDSDVAQAPELQDTIVPDSSIVECAARLSAEPSPESMTTAPPERAELDIQDYSLRLDNPYALSSLVPPKPRRFRRAVLLAVTGAVAGAVASFAGSTMLPSTPVAPRNSERPSAAITHAAPLSSAPPREPSAMQSAAPPPAMMAPVSSPIMPPQESIGADPVTVNPTAEQAPPARAETHASKPAKPAAPRRLQRTRSGRKAPATMVQDTNSPALPVTPTREQVVAGFSQIRGALVGCAAGKSGVIEIQATILSSGRISTAMIGGDFKGTAEGSCMAQAARTASFGRFSQPMLKVGFPMAL